MIEIVGYSFEVVASGLTIIAGFTILMISLQFSMKLIKELI